MEVGVSDIGWLGSFWATRKSGPNFSANAQTARGPKLMEGKGGLIFRWECSRTESATTDSIYNRTKTTSEQLPPFPARKVWTPYRLPAHAKKLQSVVIGSALPTKSCPNQLQLPRRPEFHSMLPSFFRIPIFPPWQNFTSTIRR
jgi:hypothetical protein